MAKGGRRWSSIPKRLSSICGRVGIHLIKEAVYKALDAITLGRGIERRIGGERIRFPARWSRYYEPDYEPETFRFFREQVKKGDTVLDIGGHIGLFAVVAARLVGDAGKVFSFEPTPFTRKVLQEVVNLNDCAGRVEIRSEAVSAQSGETVFFDTGDTISNANSLVKTERSKGEIPVTLVSVDEFAAANGLEVSCMKIDVEGAELDVLKGAQDTLRQARPAIRLSLHPFAIEENGQTLGEIWDTLADCGLSVAGFDREAFRAQTDLFDVSVFPSR